MASKRMTQADVAAFCKLHRTTVSLALKNHPSIPEATRQRIRAAAAKIGYEPDPMLSALAAYRSRLVPSSFRGTLAWFVRNQPGYHWREIRHFVDYYEGACAASQRYGFNLEIFDLNDPRTEPARLAKILRARNIPGLLLCPQPKSHTRLVFPWESFSAVTFGYTLAEPKLHTVTPTQYRGMLESTRQLQARGYRRIGFAFERSHNERTDRNYLAGYLAQQFGSGLDCRVPPLLLDLYADAAAIGRWYRKWKPDAIVTGDYRFLDKAKALRIRVPEQVGVSCAVLPGKTGSLAGVCEDSFHVGEVAVDVLVAMIQRGERGVPAQPQRIHIEGCWVEGESLRPLAVAP